MISPCPMFTIASVTWIAVFTVSRAASIDWLMRDQVVVDVAEVFAAGPRRPAAPGRRSSLPRARAAAPTACLQRGQLRFT